MCIKILSILKKNIQNNNVLLYCIMNDIILNYECRFLRL